MNTVQILEPNFFNVPFNILAYMPGSSRKSPTGFPNKNLASCKTFLFLPYAPFPLVYLPCILIQQSNEIYELQKLYTSLINFEQPPNSMEGNSILWEHGSIVS
jgi:hypothetical protein